MVGDLTDSQIERLLRTECVAHIGCRDGERCYVVPISFVYEEGCFYAHSAMGLKIDAMRAVPSVCVQVDHIVDLANWESVIAWGDYEELHGADADTAMALLVERLAPRISDKGGSLPHPWDEHGGAAEHILHRASRHGLVYRIRVTEITGRYEKR